MTVKIYHNPRCSKSRQTLAIICDSGKEPQVIEYLETPPDPVEIAKILELLNMDDPRHLMRKSEDAYKNLGLDDPGKSKAELIDAMAAHPVLIERPVVITEKGACLGRPPESVKKIL